MAAGAARGGFCGVVDQDGVQQLLADPLAAGEDRTDRGRAEQMGQATDHAAGALVEVAVKPGQGAGLVAVQRMLSQLSPAASL